MRIAIFGSRDYPSWYRIAKYIDKLSADSVVVSGGARGVDKFAELKAKSRGLATIIHKAEWDKYGKQAGFIRNPYIVRDSDKGIAFWDRKSNGTANTIELFKKSGKPLCICDDNGELEYFNCQVNSSSSDASR